MSTEPAPAELPKKLLIVRLGAMGDIVHTLAAAMILRRSFPDSHIGWVVEERWVELLCAAGTARSGPRSSARPLVDFVHCVNTKRWRRAPFSRETRRQLSAALREIRQQKYDAAIDFQGAIKSAILARLSGPRTVFGARTPREAPARFLYSRKVQLSGAHVIEQYESLAKAVVQHLDGKGDQVQAGAIEFPQDDAATASIGERLRSNGGEVIMLNPGAGWEAKQWPAERYADVARALANSGYKILLNYGPGEEAVVERIESASGGAAKAFSGSIAELIALLQRTRLFIGGDTGPLHLAAALGVPVVAIFGPTDPARNGPHRTQNLVLRHPASRNSLSHTGAPDPGLMQITPDQVLAAARQLLGTNHA